TTQINYQAGLHEVDFRTPEDARKIINAWVEKQTQAKIKNLIPNKDLLKGACMVLTNAIYFKGDWAVQFKKGNTKDQPWLGTNQKINTPLMHKKDKYKYLDGGTFQAVDLPYAGKDLSMVVFLPKDVNGLAEFEKTLTANKLNEWLPKMAEKEVDVYLPKF